MTMRKFDPKSLPVWARRHPEIIEVCKRDLAFRCQVHRAIDRNWRELLIGDAKRREGGN